MKITLIEEGSEIPIKGEESVASSSGVESRSSLSTTPVDEEPPNKPSDSHYSTRGVKVQYISDEDDDYTLKGNAKKKRKTGCRTKAIKQEPGRDYGGVYKPPKKRVIRKLDPKRCQVCCQHLHDPNLKVTYSYLLTTDCMFIVIDILYCWI